MVWETSLHSCLQGFGFLACSLTESGFLIVPLLTWLHSYTRTEGRDKGAPAVEPEGTFRILI